ncbi:MAG: class I SAM-dependent methyltransferase [Candidatus Kapaibacterium sp.]
MRTLIHSPFEEVPPVLAGARTIMKYARSERIQREALRVMKMLEPDKYLRWNIQFYETALERFGTNWVHADIMTALFAAANILHPANYLEIGTRRGRSLAQVAAAAPGADLYSFDIWVSNYAGEENPGPRFVTNELRKTGYAREPRYINGNSHETLPKFFSENPGMMFDLVCVDGDHERDGALRDLMDVLPHLSIGGIIVFDDIMHPYHRYLREVWTEAVRRDAGLLVHEHTDTFPGVAIGVRYAASSI